MRKKVVLLMLLAVSPAWAWAGTETTKVYVDTVFVQNHAISKVDAVIVTGILKTGIPRHCRQIGSPALTVVSTMDSADVIIATVVARSEGVLHPKYTVAMMIKVGDRREVLQFKRSAFGDLIDYFREDIPRVVSAQIEPAIMKLKNK